MTAIYTAYLFAQAKARDLWQNPLLPPHLLVQSVLLGSAVLLPFSLMSLGETADVFSPTFEAIAWILAASSVFHLLMIIGELSLTHATAHARLAAWEMVRGRYKSAFWIGTCFLLPGFCR